MIQSTATFHANPKCDVDRSILGFFTANLPKSGLGRRIFGLRSARARQNSNPDQNDDSNADPQLWDAHEVGRDGQSDDQDYESDQVGTE